MNIAHPYLQGAQEALGALHTALLSSPRHLGQPLQLLGGEGDAQHQEPVGGVKELIGQSRNLRLDMNMCMKNVL